MHTIRELESQLLIVFSTFMTSLVLPTYQVQPRVQQRTVQYQQRTQIRIEIFEFPGLGNLEACKK